ncbi:MULTISPECIES: hypothetical protein [unclassified Arthrobacter]|uniref:hypothetical protein n=1 Tax=unclassified Arthrobacter TaxID=235627 RepID=UPI002DFEC471|nr:MULTISPECIES: hypothetical protein [unclassified Arthrobacter]MEC5193066.1 hypothetical protein [Arthrobacter sp. MP_M4]MEC5204685.1 hypothetical protein [Arthrobacter sp. MP_M7]
MASTVSASAPATLQEYYRVLVAGIDAFDEGQRLRELLSDHLDFTGCLAGHIPNATDGFLHGVKGFIATVRSIDVVREVHSGHGSAVLYDAEMPAGRVRFAEFFTFHGGVIATLDLHYDGRDYLAKGGR